MAEGLGLWLRRAREARAWTLEEVETALRIRRRYLQALEVGDYTALPGTIQARGFLRNYARYLGVPVAEALARYEAEVEGRPVQPRSHPRQEAVSSSRTERPSVFRPPPTEDEESSTSSAGIPQGVLVALLGAMIFFALIAGGTLVYLQFFAGEEEVVVTPTPTLVLVPEMTTEPDVTAATLFVPAVDGKVTVRLDPQEHAWIRVVADEEVVFQGIAAPGQVVQAVAAQQCLVETGNGGAFQLFVNGEDWGVLGEQGQIVRRAWSPSGEVSLQGPPS